MVKMTKADFRVCDTCNGEVIDFWKYDSIKDTDHEGHELRLPTDEEYWEAVKNCAEIHNGYCCFTEKHLDESKNREYPDDVPPICSNQHCATFIETVWYNSYDSYNFNGKGGFEIDDKSGDCDIKCPDCGSKLGDIFEEGPINYTSENMQSFLESETGKRQSAKPTITS